jgi:uncharacterized protein (DUF885 family)
VPDRRSILGYALFAAAFAGGARAQGAPAPPRPSPAGEKLYAFFDGVVQEELRTSPETATSLGLDRGALAWTKAALSGQSIADNEEGRALSLRQLAALRALGRQGLSVAERVHYDVVAFVLDGQAAAAKFPYYGGPYAVSQLTGSYQSTPDFLDTQHAIETAEDADAYLARLNAFARQMDEEREVVRHDAGLGVIPPDFILDKTLQQMRAFAGVPAERSPLVASLARRAKEKGLSSDYEGEAGRLYESQVRPALERQIALMAELRAKAGHAAGVRRLPDGEAFYALALKSATTSSLSPAEIHKTGLDLVKSHQSQLDALMKTQGYTQGTVGERLRALYADPKLRYPNTDEAKVELIAALNRKVAEVSAKLPAVFGALPKARLEIRRVPKAIEAGAPGGYYNGPPLDNSRPGIYWINLRDTAEVPTWTLPTLTFHEGVPGHHLQISIANEAGDLPLIRKMIGFSGYQEGWALYAEELAVELGMYDQDPLGHIGQLHDSMFRAVRLVVDSGLHAQGWSREEAVRYYVDTLGDQEPSAVTEVERYCVWPGQACSYMVGKLEWLRLRAAAKARLGPRFDIRAFHDAGLLTGPTPLDVLAGILAGYA